MEEVNFVELLQEDEEFRTILLEAIKELASEADPFLLLEYRKNLSENWGIKIDPDEKMGAVFTKLTNSKINQISPVIRNLILILPSIFLFGLIQVSFMILNFLYAFLCWAILIIFYKFKFYHYKKVTVEKEEIAAFVELIASNRFVTLNLRNSDFSTADRIGEVINSIYTDSAVVLDAGTVKVKIPEQIDRAAVVRFIDNITQLKVIVDMPAVVVINERTGTIVVGENVGISTVAISQGSLVIKIKESEIVSQPTAPFSDAGTTQRVPDTTISVEEKSGHLIPVMQAVTVSELARTLNAIGATPRDLIAIFNALKKSGALQAKLVIM